MTKVRNLAQAAEIADQDFMYLVDFSVGSNAGRKITIEQLKEFLIGGGIDTEEFLQYQNATQQTTTSTAYVPVTLDTDLNSRINTYFTKISATGFQADFTGHAKIFCSVSFFMGANDRQATFAIQKNGVTISGSERVTSAKDAVTKSNTVSMEIINPCVPSDVYTLVRKSGDGTLVTIPIDSAFMKTEVYRVGS